ncbi:uncharacterized protein JN550_012143 [Neoarthrinium moseri]|uniref:uncharacterized protein n=1 Tax=Neoarthrinium moseri TaxID=1658444 RepID=UPI001FDCDAEE|nr:uncharacterized protein JN550_012143 [Neoarthrinium moseri]KAI1859223.1 hypothetical protein JN550_012143 [Neoarthrinium moseri]
MAQSSRRSASSPPQPPSDGMSSRQDGAGKSIATQDMPVHQPLNPSILPPQGPPPEHSPAPFPSRPEVLVTPKPEETQPNASRYPEPPDVPQGYYTSPYTPSAGQPMVGAGAQPARGDRSSVSSRDRGRGSLSSSATSQRPIAPTPARNGRPVQAIAPAPSHEVQSHTLPSGNDQSSHHTPYSFQQVQAPNNVHTQAYQQSRSGMPHGAAPGQFANSNATASGQLIAQNIGAAPFHASNHESFVTSQQHSAQPYPSGTGPNMAPQSPAFQQVNQASYPTTSIGAQQPYTTYSGLHQQNGPTQFGEPQSQGAPRPVATTGPQGVQPGQAIQQTSQGMHQAQSFADNGGMQDEDQLMEDDADDLGDDLLLTMQNSASTLKGSMQSLKSLTGVASDKNLFAEFSDKQPSQRKIIKRGPRKPAEPTADVKMRLSAATSAFMSGDLDEALRQVNDAIRLNGEIHRSWDLLAEILRERGENKPSLLASVCSAHLQPKIFEVWLNCGRFALDLLEEEPEDSEDTLKIAIMTLSQAIKIQPDNIGVRQLRAALYLTRESFKLATSEYKWIVERSPDNVVALRGLADASVQLYENQRRVAKGQREIARDAYLLCIEHVQAEYPTGASLTDIPNPFTWDDACTYIALLLHLEQFEDALKQARSLSRWLLGRQKEDFWDNLSDDREWDIGDERRKEIPEYKADEHPAACYGQGLPLRLRVNLAICRLRLDRAQDDEAMQHLEFLDPAEVSETEDGAEQSELFLEVASALYETKRLTKALPFFEPLRRQDDFLDATNLYRAGKCYLEVGDKRQAEECFTAALDFEETPTDTRVNARYELAKMYEAARKNQEALELLEEAMGIEKERDEEVAGTSGQQNGDDRRPGKPRIIRKIAPKPKLDKKPREPKERKSTGPRKPRDPNKKPREKIYRQRPLLFALDEDRRLEEERKSAYLAEQWSFIREAQDDAEDGPSEAWMEAAKALIDDFRSFKAFYPWDRYLTQMGLKKDESESATANPHLLKMAQRLRDEVDAQQSSINSRKLLETTVSYRNVDFSEWLHLFLEYALSLAHTGHFKDAYNICEAAMGANVFFENPEDKFLINITMAACAVRGMDEERCVEVARGFMATYAFSSDAFRMYAALSRLCDTTATWYADSRVQKFTLRQIKMMDSALIPADDRVKGTLDGFDPKVYPGKEMDVQLLMLYGHILFISNSFTFALNYFIRAYALDPDNLMINISIGQAYLHYALKRQSENRQQAISQGFTFLHRYYDAKLATAMTAEQRQEAHYNLARSYHAVGLTHLAAEYYRRVFLEIEGDEIGEEDLAREAAYNLQQCCLIGGDIEAMRDIADRWLVL